MTEQSTEQAIGHSKSRRPLRKIVKVGQGLLAGVVVVGTAAVAAGAAPAAINPFADTPHESPTTAPATTVPVTTVPATTVVITHDGPVVTTTVTVAPPAHPQPLTTEPPKPPVTEPATTTPATTEPATTAQATTEPAKTVDPAPAPGTGDAAPGVQPAPVQPSDEPVTTAAPETTVAPAPPTTEHVSDSNNPMTLQLSCSLGGDAGNSVSCTWSGPTPSGFAKQLLLRGTTSGGPGRVPFMSADPSANSYVNSNVPAGSYSYLVVILDAAGKTLAHSNPVPITVAAG